MHVGEYLRAFAAAWAAQGCYWRGIGKGAYFTTLPLMDCVNPGPSGAKKAMGRCPNNGSVRSRIWSKQ